MSEHLLGKGCIDLELHSLIFDIWGSEFNSSSTSSIRPCNATEEDGKRNDMLDHIGNHGRLEEVGLDIYSYLTPFLIVIGLLGNLISLRVFSSKAMRKASASWYLSALAISDSTVLLSYVLGEWLNQGLPRWPWGHRLPFKNTNGVCQSFLFASYIFRFFSSWLIVIFTLERYIGVCKPLHRRGICTHTFAKRAMASLLASSVLLSLYKPILNTVVEGKYGAICTYRPGYETVSYVLDNIYALSITAAPFSLIVVFNALIIKQLIKTRRNNTEFKSLKDNHSFKLEFTMILLVVSTAFVAMSLPFFAVWCYNFRKTLEDDTSQIWSLDQRIRGVLYLTKTIFILNYSMNFFLYSLTGERFRKHVIKTFFSGCSKPAPRYPQSPSNSSKFGSKQVTTVTWHEGPLTTKSSSTAL